MITEVVSKPVYRILNTLTGEPRVEVALPLALKELLQLRLHAANQQRSAFEKRYGVDFPTFQKNWNNAEEVHKHSYEVEQDFWEWEAAVSDVERYHEMLKSLP